MLALIMREHAKRNFREVVKVKKVAVIYWSGIGNTEKVAEEVRNGIAGQGFEAGLPYSWEGEQ